MKGPLRHFKANIVAYHRDEIDDAFFFLRALMETLQSLKKHPGMVQHVKRKGEVLFNNRQPSDPDTIGCWILTQGSGIWMDPMAEEWERRRVNIGSRSGWTVSSGQFVGLLQFLSGGRGEKSEKEMQVSY